MIYSNFREQADSSQIPVNNTIHMLSGHLVFCQKVPVNLRFPLQAAGTAGISYNSYCKGVHKTEGILLELEIKE